jgi:hypothetical protein
MDYGKRPLKGRKHPRGFYISIFGNPLVMVFPTKVKG